MNLSEEPPFYMMSLQTSELFEKKSKNKKVVLTIIALVSRI